MEIITAIFAFFFPARGDDTERGDVPGWVLVTLMTAALVVAIWTVAQTQLVQVFESAINKIAVI